MKDNVLKLIFNKTTVVVSLLLVQLIVLLGLIYFLNQRFVYVYVIFIFIGILSVLFLVNKKDIPEVKLAWIVCILVLPIFGVALYMLLGEPILDEKYKNKLKIAQENTQKYLKQDETTSFLLKETDHLIATQSRYIHNVSGYPVHQNTTTKHLELGEVKFECLKEELRKAKRYIFLQYFIIGEGKMWGEILEILTKKASEGIDVRVMYDDAGCVGVLPNGYHITLRKLGIKCEVINPLRARLNIVLQNRDHCKIVVIDGEVGFTGGINLSDEYINVYPKHGHWKDSAIMLKGDAVFSLVVMFMQTWCFFSDKDEDFNQFKPQKPFIPCNDEKGFVQPYSDNPLDKEYVAQRIYQNILNQASDYVYITSPYFVVDDEVLNTFLGTAKRGIDIRVITPHVGDKWYVHWVTRSFYKPLIEAGVKVYEYTPGFIHSKTFVSDDTIATMGTVNLDYRSLYHHFECGVWLYKANAVLEQKKDFLNTLELCKKMSIEDCDNEKWYKKVYVSLVKIVTPLF